MSSGWKALALVLAAALLSLAFRFPRAVPYYLLAVFTMQPILLRLIPRSADLWPLVKYADEVSLAALLPIAVIGHLIRRTSPLPVPALIGLGAVISIGLVASWMQGTSPYLVALDGFLLFKGFLAFVIVSGSGIDSNDARRLLLAALAFAVAAGAFGLLEMLAPGMARGLLPTTREGIRFGRTAMISVFPNEGQAGWFFAFAAMACYAFYCVYRRHAYLALFVGFACCSLLTLRRKPIGGMLVVLVLSVLVTRQMTGRLRIILLLVAFFICVGAVGGDSIVMLFTEGYDTYVAARDPTRVARNAMYLGAFELAVDYFPLGVGFGLFGGYVSQLYYSQIYHELGLSQIWGLSPTEDMFLLDAFWPHVLGQFGFIGLLGFGVALVALWAPLFRSGSHDAGPFVRAVTLAAVFTFIEAFVESAAMGLFEATLPSFLLFGMAAVATCVVGDAATGSKATAYPTRPHSGGEPEDAAAARVSGALPRHDA